MFAEYEEMLRMVEEFFHSDRMTADGKREYLDYLEGALMEIRAGLEG